MTEHGKHEVTMPAGDAIVQASDELDAIWTKMMWAAQEDEPYAESAAHAAAMLIEAGTADLSRRAEIEGFLAMEVTAELTTRPGAPGWEWALTERLADARELMRVALEVIEENMAMSAQDDWFSGRPSKEAQFERLMKLCDQIAHLIARTEGLTLPELTD